MPALPTSSAREAASTLDGYRPRTPPRNDPMRLTPPVLSAPALRPRALRTLALSALLACACPLVLAAEPAPKARTTQEILDGSRPSDWRALDPARTLYMELASGRVIIELAPVPVRSRSTSPRSVTSTRWPSLTAWPKSPPPT